MPPPDLTISIASSASAADAPPAYEEVVDTSQLPLLANQVNQSTQTSTQINGMPVAMVATPPIDSECAGCLQALREAFCNRQSVIDIVIATITTGAGLGFFSTGLGLVSAGTESIRSVSARQYQLDVQTNYKLQFPVCPKLDSGFEFQLVEDNTLHYFQPFTAVVASAGITSAMAGFAIPNAVYNIVQKFLHARHRIRQQQIPEPMDVVVVPRQDPPPTYYN